MSVVLVVTYTQWIIWSHGLQALSMVRVTYLSQICQVCHMCHLSVSNIPKKEFQVCHLCYQSTNSDADVSVRKYFLFVIIVLRFFKVTLFVVGVLTHEDGMRQLSKMEQQTGIFTMRCTLSIENNMVSIVDGQSGVSLHNRCLIVNQEPSAACECRIECYINRPLYHLSCTLSRMKDETIWLLSQAQLLFY